MTPRSPVSPIRAIDEAVENYPEPSRAGDSMGKAMELVRRWATFMEAQGLAESTRRQYRRSVVNFLADTLIDPLAVTEDDIVDYLWAMSPPMRNQVLRALKSFYAFAAERELVLDPTRRLRVKRPKYGPAPSLSRQELDALLDALEEIDPRARPAGELAYCTGARIGSLVRVTEADIRNDVITFREAKGGKTYSVPLGSRAKQAVKRLLELRDYTPPKGKRRPTLVGVGANTIRGWLHDAAAKAKLIRVTPHLLRHTYATRLAEMPEVTIREWVELMGHETPELFRRYAAVADTDLRERVEAL